MDSPSPRRYPAIVEAVLITNRKRPLEGMNPPAGLSVVEAGSPGEALEQARRAVEGGVRRVLVAGGDGSVHAVLPALAGTGVLLGVVPAGTGNDLAASLRLPGEAGRALAFALEAGPRPVDLLELLGAGRRNLAAVGVAAGAAVRVQGRLDAWRRRQPGFTRRLGRAGFVATALAEAVSPATVQARVEWEAGSWAGPLLGMMLYLHSCFGGGFPCPGPGGACDGRFTGVLLHDPGSPARRLALVTAFRAGWAHHGWVETFRGRRVRVRAEGPVPIVLDGEYRRRRDPVFRLLPGALLVAAA